MKPEPGIFEQRDPAAEAAADARAEADIAAGRTFSNAEIVAWLETSGAPARQPLRRKWQR